MKYLKQTILIIATLLFGSYNTFSIGGGSDDKSKTIIFDFTQKQFMSLEDSNYPKSPKPYIFNHQDDIVIKVININLNKYEVTFDTLTRTYEYASVSTEEEKSEENQESTADDNKDNKDAMHQIIGEGIELPTMSLDDSIQVVIEMGQKVFDISEYNSLKSQLEKLMTSDITATDAKTFKDQYSSKFEQSKKELSEEFKAFKKFYEALKEKSKGKLTLEQVEKMEEAVTLAENNLKSLNEISALFESLKAENFWTLFTLTNIEDDLIIIKLNIKEKTDEEGAGETYSASIKVRGKWKIDASTGALFNFVSYDYNYFINGDGIIKRGQSRQKITPVYPVALMHFYQKGKTQTSYGFSGGFGLTEDVELSFYLGASALVGENQRWIITAGTSLRPVSRLKSQYTKEQNLSDLGSLPEESDLVEDIHQLGAFISLTYNLTKSD